MEVVEAGIDGVLGQRLRQLRVERGLSLDALADRAEVSRAMLSRIERGESSPTAQLLNKVCGGLGITLSALFAEAERRSGPLSLRQEQAEWRDPATGYLRRNVSPSGREVTIDLVEVEFPAGTSVGFDNGGFRGVTQLVWLLAGTMEITLGDDVFHLEAGDCLHLKLDRPIRYHNPSTLPARYAVILHSGDKKS